MKGYILSRLWKSIVAIFVVVAIVIIMVYTMIPQNQVFKNDTALTKLSGNNKEIYMSTVLENLGYISYYSQAEMCTAKADDYEACMIKDSEEQKKVISLFEKDGYKVQALTKNDSLKGNLTATRNYGRIELVLRYFANLIKIDHPNVIKDANNPDLKRGYSLGGNAGNWGLLCSGCENKYQLYVNGSFPFIHQNIIGLNFGRSYPTYPGADTLDVITRDQGRQKSILQTFPTGKEMKSPLKQDTCKYKYKPDPLDKMRFTDNYANCSMYGESPSMIKTSYLFGILPLIFAYLVSMPVGIYMARKKGKLPDKLGIIYINFLIAIPSLAFILLMKYVGNNFGLPDKFSQFGFNDIRSYIMPIIILGLMSTPGIMMWLRRYMIDQSSSDYVKFAKAKGLNEKEIFNNHILKNAIIPIVNGIPASIILAISGAVITESVFSIPGMGKMLPDAINASNNNMVITLTFIFTSLSILSVLLGDLLMTLVDPRIQLDTRKGE